MVHHPALPSTLPVPTADVHHVLDICFMPDRVLSWVGGGTTVKAWIPPSGVHGDGVTEHWTGALGPALPELLTLSPHTLSESVPHLYDDRQDHSRTK